MAEAMIGPIVMGAEPMDVEAEHLRSENRRLQRALRDAEVEAQRAREDAERSMSNLRRQLSPLYRALQMVFGELDAAGVSEAHETSRNDSASAGTTTRVAQVWAEWKQKIGPASAQARVIDALLVHGSLNVQQLKVAAKMANQTVYDATSKLNKLGLINKSGGKYSLKELP